MPSNRPVARERQCVCGRTTRSFLTISQALLPVSATAFATFAAGESSEVDEHHGQKAERIVSATGHHEPHPREPDDIPSMSSNMLGSSGGRLSISRTCSILSPMRRRANASAACLSVPFLKMSMIALTRSNLSVCSANWCRRCCVFVTPSKGTSYAHGRSRAVHREHAGCDPEHCISPK